MSQFLHVFGSVAAGVEPDAIADTAEEAWYGDDDLEVVRAPAKGILLTITPPGKSRPISVEAETDPGRVDTMVREQLDEHEQTPPDVAEKLQRTRQVISIEIFPETIDDEGWELLDVLQSWLARELKGFVVTDDGIYDSGLQQLAP